RVLLPFEGAAARDDDVPPLLGALEDHGIALLELLALDEIVDRAVELLLRRPNVAEIDLFPVLADADRILGKIDLHRARDRVRHHERRRGEIVSAGKRRDTSLKVSVA